ncbi:MAG: 30S ribosomal protein S1 [Planctomycetes bacterium RIFCSPHIGHO2_02_FULL_50_42]|nr:MAG: 30S ribosomal protein S1 [Planctomycetes bacterium GWA2_50_13]OHB88449.1 MAG: 30S ribosomal protein S1 [Planctomycetes bacterium RIFCSPHIGHO2_02_FULL_50_42]OHB92275.1 MAG: 30S ribosomal protein S1 [Planctomycetes bacterium RIFCSPHIGHO2_12_FULL_51_37]OHB95178.1 MAG: 30S ribosomal protein S1 [Planctomycetes bacterium RIFCSPLOWO2_02_FULL_50_16]OHC02603.1 MAG: 30S ribosomal protein S1 [Planctomycetes bacterium RIFCSPLOWO2_12_FULL_50_35]HCN20621.1 30S ribosomal protein S1 [Planctomycetia ba
MPRVDVVRQYDIDLAEIEREVEAAVGVGLPGEMEKVYTESIRNFEAGSILKGKVLALTPTDVIIDCGYKSEGVIPSDEFDNISRLKVGDEIEVLLETVEDDSGLIKLSKRKADRIRGWEKVITRYKEGDVVTGTVTRKIKGGLLVDLGIPVFLPASQIDVKPPGDIAEYIGKEVTCKILKIDETRQNIVVSRRRLLEEEREGLKLQLLAEIKVGDLRKGVVKNIADFGAFVDLGGLDGLLHITDMSWGRISHPTDMLTIGQEIEVRVLGIDKEKEKIALGLKQKTESPWAKVEERYPAGSRVSGQVVNIMPYGAFVKLEDGIEGLVHVSEMSWTRRVNHPSEMVSIEDTVEVLILKVNKEKQEISLSMKQTEENPWDRIEQRYPPGKKISGTVRNLANYGAFVEIEDGIDGLLHVSDISWSKKVTHPGEMLKKGDTIEAVVLSVDKEKKRVALGMKQLEKDPWESDIPNKYQVGGIVKGKVTKLTNFGAFVELEKGIEGLLHVSEMSDKKVSDPQGLVSIGDEIEVKIIRLDASNRKLGLSMKRAAETTQEEGESGEETLQETEK